MKDLNTREDYYTQISTIIDELQDNCQRSDILDRADLDRWLHETLDGHHWVIYFAYNYDVLSHSDNDGAYIAEFGAEGLIDGDRLRTENMAMWAMMADCHEEMNRRDFDFDDESTWNEEE